MPNAALPMAATPATPASDRLGVTTQAALGRTCKFMRTRLFRSTEYSSCLENLNRLRSPSPQRGRGVRGEGASSRLKALREFRDPQSELVSGMIRQRGIPLTPSPSPALGRGEPILQMRGLPRSPTRQLAERGTEHVVACRVDEVASCDLVYPGLLSGALWGALRSAGVLPATFDLRRPMKSRMIRDW